MKRPPEPTPEELTKVANYWGWVEQTVRSQGFDDTPKPPQPKSQELDKVGAWKTWQALMSCTHSGGITFSSGVAEMTCSDCGDLMTFLSETQIEEMERKRDEH